ncbi:unnamed protein product [Onchocerca ochengi]|uniref:ULP_PROTEASE domain-containing protein n=1 Tax=Onchocerca ochengi TaxID=42157 RepID=A0A182E8F1_ONCOC|nr:unnamed protein product [Onchocerca ochengi]
MDFFPTIEDPHHTPGKRHGYAKEQSSPQAFSNNNQKSLLSSFIITPPVVKPQNHLTDYNFKNADKFYRAKQQKQERKSYTSFNPSQKSAFLAYRSFLNQKSSEVQIDRPSIIGDTLVNNDGILRPKPRYVTSINQNPNKNATALCSVQYSRNNNDGATQIMGISRQKDTAPQHQPVKMACSEFGSRVSPVTAEKKVDLPRMKNFKNILNTFQMASDHALRQQQQRERIRYNTSDYESDQRFSISDWEQSTDFADSERNNTLTRKHQHLRAFTISIPTVGKNIRKSLPKQWIMQVNAAYMDVEPRSPTMSGISSIPPSPPISSHKPPNETNSPKFRSMEQRTFSDNGLHRNEPVIHQLQHARSCTIRCTSMESYKGLKISSAQMSSHSPLLSPSKSRGISSETEDDDSASVVGLYKQAEPTITLSCPMKPDLSDGNIWNPPTLVEIKAQQDEEQRILRGSPRNRSNQKYRFLIIPRYNLLTFKAFAANYQHIDIREEYEQKVCFILLQLVCALKSLQLNGIEAISDDLSEFILLCRYTRTNHNIGSMDHLPRILLLQESLRTMNKKPIIGLCDYGLKILSTILNLNSHSLTNFTSSIQECAKALQEDKSSSLTEAKNALEFGMFASHDASSFSDEEDIQAWIDSKRADYVNYLVKIELVMKMINSGAEEK